MNSVPVDMLDYYDEEVVRRIIGSARTVLGVADIRHARESCYGDVAVWSGRDIQHLGKRKDHRFAEELGIPEDGLT